MTSKRIDHVTMHSTIESLLLIIGPVIIAIIALFTRLNRVKRPLTVKSIIIPPVMMSTGSIMFLFPIFRIQWVQALQALCIGIVCSVILIKVSKLSVKDGKIYLTRSKAFMFILLGLLTI